MKTVCIKSGLTLSVCDDGINQTVLNIHPIFRLDRESLFKLMAKVPPSSDIKKRLYFLALLNITDLVIDWNKPFIPNDETIALGFQPLVELHALLQKRGDNLPRVRLDEECDILEIIKVWKRAVYGFGSVSTATEADKMLAITETWHKSAQNKLQARHINLACECLYKVGYSDGAVTAASSVLAMQSSAVSLTRLGYLRELYDNLQDCLPCDNHNRNVSFYILRHVQDMIDYIVKVKADVLGQKVSKEERIIAGVTSFQLIEVSEKDAEAIEELRQIAALPEPKQVDFSSYGDFLKARANWRSAKFAAISKMSEKVD